MERELERFRHDDGEPATRRSRALRRPSLADGQRQLGWPDRLADRQRLGDLSDLRCAAATSATATATATSAPATTPSATSTTASATPASSASASTTPSASATPATTPASATSSCADADGEQDGPGERARHERPGRDQLWLDVRDDVRERHDRDAHGGAEPQVALRRLVGRLHGHGPVRAVDDGEPLRHREVRSPARSLCRPERRRADRRQGEIQDRHVALRRRIRDAQGLGRREEREGALPGPAGGQAAQARSEGQPGRREGAEALGRLAFVRRTE